MTHNQSLFNILLIAALSVFAWGVWHRFLLIILGKPVDRFDNIGSRIQDTLLYAFGQKRVLTRLSGFNHFVIFWSFIILVIANTEFLLHGVFPGISLSRLPDGIHFPLLLVMDLVSLLALIAVSIAAIRRIVMPPFSEARTPEAFFILALVAILMLANFGINAARIVGGEFTGPISWLPVSSRVALIIASSSASSFYTMCWWTHAFALLIFICYLPNSKHMHILTAIPNCFFRRLKKPNTVPREEFRVGMNFGVDQVDRYSWKDLLDSFSCTECGRCQNACPATATGKPLNPRQVIHDIKSNLLENGRLLKNGEKPQSPLIGDQGDGSICEEAIWACTTCGACMEACPVFIEHTPKLIELRRHLVESEARFPEELLNLFENMEGRSNPWGIAPSERTKWCSTMDEKHFEKDKTEYLFFVGCAGSFDARQKHITVALATILDAAGVSWGILGKEERCCGDSLRRLGNEFVFDRMVKENVKLFEEHGVKKVITTCPHCFSTLKNDYRQYGLELQVIHHGEFLNELLTSGRLKLNRQVSDLGKIVFHDSCYLGRHNDIYDAPREVIRLATGETPVEMERHRSNSFCCGAGGGRMWMEEFIGTRINHARVEEAIEEKPDTVCVSCPYCMTMFEDGLKDKRAGHVRVRDIAEVVAEGLIIQ